MPDKRREPLRQGERQQEQAERVAVAHRGPCQVCRQAIPRPTSGAIVTTAVMMPSRVSFATGSTSPRAGCGQTVRRKPCVWLNLLDPDGLWALVAGLDIKGDARALAERAKAFPLDIGLVDEEVLAVVFRRNETEALVVVEPLHGSCRHLDLRSVAYGRDCREARIPRTPGMGPRSRLRLVGNLYTPMQKGVATLTERRVGPG